MRGPGELPLDDHAIVVRNLRKQYGAVTALTDLSFEVEAGEIFGLLGPNGSGKTTAVECIQGLREADGGSIRVLGIDPQRERSRLHGLIGCQLQESALPERIRVWEALDLFSAMTPRAADWQELLHDWGLTEKRNTAFADLSGGQRQRLLVALALVSRPRIVFLDEMTTGLDPAARRVAWELIETIRERGTTVLLVTHFMDEAERLCDRIAVMNKGSVLATGTPADLVARFAGDAVVRFSTDETGLQWLHGVPGVVRVERDGREVTVHGNGPLLAYTAAALVEHGIAPLDLHTERRTLEDAYLNLSGASASLDA